MKSLIASLCICLCVYTLQARPDLHKKPTRILVLFHTTSGGTWKLAQAIAAGITQQGATAVLKQVPAIDKNIANAAPGVPYADVAELPQYDGIAFGSAVHFGNMTAAMRLFLDGTVDHWTHHRLEGVPATVFMSAGSGAGREAAILSFWNTLAVHGMVIVPTGIMGAATLQKNIAQGNTVFGATSLASMPGSARPSASELEQATLQGAALARVAIALAAVPRTVQTSTPVATTDSIAIRMNRAGIVLPPVPAPAGNYKPFTRAGNLVYINQVALKEGSILHPGIVEKEISVADATAATRQTMLNVLAVLQAACDGDLSRVKQCVQLTGFFNTAPGFKDHAKLMNAASDLTVAVFGDKGKHARATVGAASLPVNSSVEIQAVFEIE
ncbi:Atu1372/SO_1960 family protein [Chitinophaga nivalis]|uniref:Atu1372/SO_1960 family protein n=1 Tax=Chitinophaga nivalis TaxID=2991709 RepID=A0ABT3IND0_9BACT|nr:Atu1372/SO_1960 family protein [Chitinophaga nivalis]MCW3464837.1 Atu1372/SO_1960 family protein [Chitinophaga nivalis]MCW3485472.1 Atu1372/SO_1960 family protein [Chitinophaga nivalis]